jgi:pimeloyl-ACP methyl ester carboxylesterase
MKKVISKDGTAIAFDQVGSGPPLVVVDGALCSRSMGPTPKLVPLLARFFTVISYDRRGRNDSGDAPAYAVEREIEDIAALLRHAGEPAFVFGMSSGAALALKATAAGLPVRKLALFEPPYVARGASLTADGYREQVTRLIASGQRSDAVKLFMRHVGMPSLLIAVLRLLPLWSKVTAVAGSLPYDAAIMGDGSVPAAAAAVKVPALVFGGDKSPDGLQNAVHAAADAIPGAQRLMLKGQSHNVSAKSLAPVLREFFAV